MKKYEAVDRLRNYGEMYEVMDEMKILSEVAPRGQKQGY